MSAHKKFEACLLSRHVKSSPFVLLCIFAAVMMSNECTGKGIISVHAQRQSVRVGTDIGMVMQKLFKHMGPEDTSSAPKVCRQPHRQASLLKRFGGSTHRFAEELICDDKAQVTREGLLMTDCPQPAGEACAVWIQRGKAQGAGRSTSHHCQHAQL